MRLHGFLSLLVVAMLVTLGGCATRPVNPPIEQVDLGKGYRFDTRWARRSNYDAENLVVLAFSGGGTAGGRVLLWRPRNAAGNGARRAQGPEDPHARRSGPRHGSVGRQLHRAGLWFVRGQAVRHLREQLPEARRAGRADRARPESPLLGRTVIRKLGPLRAGGAVLRRDTFPRGHLRRSGARHRPASSRERHRHLDRAPGWASRNTPSTSSART